LFEEEEPLVAVPGSTTRLRLSVSTMIVIGGLTLIPSARPD
jgi:hypothetical protein